MNICNITNKLLDTSNKNKINKLMKNDIQHILKNPNHYFYNYINYVIISQMFIKNIKIQHSAINKTHNILNILELLYLYYKQFYKNILINPSSNLSILESHFSETELNNYNLFINKLTNKIQYLYNNSNGDNYEMNSSSNESFVYNNNTIHINYKNILLELLNFLKNKENILDVLIYDFEIEFSEEIQNNIRIDSTNEKLNKFLINNEHLKKININYYKLLILILEKRFKVLEYSYNYQQKKIKKQNSKAAENISKNPKTKNPKTKNIKTKKSEANIIKLSNNIRYNIRRYFEIDTLNKNILKIFFNSIRNTQLLTPEFNLLFNPFTSLINLIEIYNQVSHKITLTFTFDNSNYFINDKPLNMVGDIEKDTEYLKSLPELHQFYGFDTVFEFIARFYNEKMFSSDKKKYKIVKFDGKIEFYLSSENIDLIELFSVGVNPYIIEIISRYCCFNYILGSSRVPENFIIFLVDFNKSMMHVKDKKDLIFTSSEINTGVTNMRDIIITRFEEFMKTMIHELFHFHDMDFKSTPKFLTDFVIEKLGIKTNILDRNGDETLNIFEAYVEYNASIINIFYHLFFNIFLNNNFVENKSISNTLLKNKIFKNIYNFHLVNYKFKQFKKYKPRYFNVLDILCNDLIKKNINNEKLLDILCEEITNQINYTIYKLSNILKISNIFEINNFKSLEQLLFNNNNKLNIKQSTNVISYFLLKLIFYFNIIIISNNICYVDTSKFKICDNSFQIIKKIINGLLNISYYNQSNDNQNNNNSDKDNNCNYILLNTINYYLNNSDISDFDKKLLDNKNILKDNKNILKDNKKILKDNKKFKRYIKQIDKKKSIKNKIHISHSNTLKMTCIGI
jgi:hypothetical protein